MADLGSSLTVALAAHERAADHFWSFMADRSVRFLPQGCAPMFFSTVCRMVVGQGDRAGRRAGLAVLGRMYRRFGLYPYHGTVVAAAVVDTVRRFAGASWEPELAGCWEQGCRRVLRVAERAATVMGDGPHVTVGEVVACDAAADGVAVLTVRPMRRLRFLPGQAMPVCTPRLPGLWRWYSPANAPRRDGTVEFHVRAVGEGVVSPVLVERVALGEELWLGPAVDVGLSLEAAGEADVLLAAGGTGLAPLRALVEQVAASPVKRRVTLVVGARTLLDLYDAVALDELAQAHRDWLTVELAFSDDGDVEPAAQGDLLTVALYHYRRGQAFYVCGSPKLIEAARVRLPAAGIPADSLHLATTFRRAMDSVPWVSRQRSSRVASPSGVDMTAGGIDRRGSA
ncbi:FAD-binding oxidoreductase [Micromonospora sp. WMMD718]|uniref:FAD-binding oxidoreductase n=1 Tax=unclassified Micromonospora TaxID=2617518 RepID=UPI0009E5EFF7|nr:MULTISPECIES: FAD-binding oxidoreductase [unclassified Micromonospora]MDG4751294.1 FAD-binding oxidoreductase [Micromonospora sp. WMMD718]